MDGGTGTALSYTPVRSKAYPASKNALSVDARYWRSFKNKGAPQHIAAVTSIQFCAAEPHDFAVTSSTRVRALFLLLEVLQIRRSCGFIMESLCIHKYDQIFERF